MLCVTGHFTFILMKITRVMEMMVMPMSALKSWSKRNVFCFPGGYEMKQFSKLQESGRDVYQEKL